MFYELSCPVKSSDLAVATATATVLCSISLDSSVFVALGFVG